VYQKEGVCNVTVGGIYSYHWFDSLSLLPSNSGRKGEKRHSIISGNLNSLPFQFIN